MSLTRITVKPRWTPDKQHYPKEVRAYRIDDSCLCVHRWDGSRHGKWWSITHIPSGLTVANAYDCRMLAVDVARLLLADPNVGPWLEAATDVVTDADMCGVAQTILYWCEDAAFRKNRK